MVLASTIIRHMHAAPSILLRLLKWEDEMKMAAEHQNYESKRFSFRIIKRTGVSGQYPTPVFCSQPITPPELRVRKIEFRGAGVKLRPMLEESQDIPRWRSMRMLAISGQHPFMEYWPMA
jgi:hypothetical protein